jgi:hypothetical protein
VAPRPMANMLAAATDGQTSVTMTPEEFIYLDRDCDLFMTLIRQIQQIADDVSRQDVWGLGEANDRLTSARAMVGRYKVKGRGAPDGNGSTRSWSSTTRSSRIFGMSTGSCAIR